MTIDNAVIPGEPAPAESQTMAEEVSRHVAATIGGTKTIYPTMLLSDFYKCGESHTQQYPKGTQFIYAGWTPRESRIKGITEVVAFGFQALIQEWLIDYFDVHFFSRPLEEVEAEYVRVIRYTLNVEEPHVQHIRDLHNLGYLPIEIKAVPEGEVVPIRCPMLTIENTDERFFWLTNFLETLFSCEAWQPSTSATIARTYRQDLELAAETTGADKDFVLFQGHDFSMRGMEGVVPAAKSGGAHLLSFRGTDTIPAICWLEHYYGANIEIELVGTSIPATEHSVMCAHGQMTDEDEIAAFRYLMTEVYPTGMVSIVSDTRDFWNVLSVVLPALKDDIMARDGKVVIRPDSGDPVDILCGTQNDYDTVPVRKGAVEMLYDLFGGTTNALGYRELDSHIGIIYGDSITMEREQQIWRRLAKKKFSSSNFVLGIGSYTYQLQTRDTFGFALKSIWCMILGVEHNIFKDPATDIGKMKKSNVGRVVVVREGGVLHCIDGLTLETQKEYTDRDVLQVIFRDGKPTNITTLAEVRERLWPTAA